MSVGRQRLFNKYHILNYKYNMQYHHFRDQDNWKSHSNAVRILSHDQS